MIEAEDLMPCHITESDDEPPEEVTRDENTEYEAERQLEAEEAAHRIERNKRAKERLPLALLDIARIPGLMRRKM